MKTIEIVIRQDDASHWYIIPKTENKEFSRLMDILYECDFEDMDTLNEFESQFGPYRTSGINGHQLLITEDELNRLKGKKVQF